MIRPMDVTPEVIAALATLRKAAGVDELEYTALTEAFNVLDETGVFAEIDEAIESDEAERNLTAELLDELMPTGRPTNPTESTYEQLPDNFAELVDELSRPVVSDDGTVVPPAL